MINKVKFPKKLNKRNIEKFFKNKKLHEFIKLSKCHEQKINELEMKKPFKPELEDLYRLYQFVVLNKRTTILEFGSGWSSIIFAMALNDLQKKYNMEVKKLRRNNPFELFVLENEKKFFKKIKSKLKGKKYKNKITKSIKLHFSDVQMTNYNGHFATEYKSLPLCNPDFIYLDGPGQFKVKGNVNGITTAHYDMMPMVCDILKFEYFFVPGTIIVVDGRSANAQFLRDNFKRKWEYQNDKLYDQHIFYLNNDNSLGKYNDRQLQFYSRKTNKFRN